MSPSLLPSRQAIICSVHGVIRKGVYIRALADIIIPRSVDRLLTFYITCVSARNFQIAL